MAFALFAEIERLINERGSATILRERNNLLLERIAQLKDDYAKLEKENTELKKLVAHAPAPLAARRPAGAEPEDLVEERGAFFKKRPGGGYHNMVYCWKCFNSTSAWPPGSGPYACDCGWISDIMFADLPGIIKSLP